MAKTTATEASKPLSAAERHCCRHVSHIIVRGVSGHPLTATVIGGDASGLVLREDISSVEDAKALFIGYDLRLEVS